MCCHDFFNIQYRIPTIYNYLVEHASFVTKLALNFTYIWIPGRYFNCLRSWAGKPNKYQSTRHFVISSIYIYKATTCLDVAKEEKLRPRPRADQAELASSSLLDVSIVSSARVIMLPELVLELPSTWQHCFLRRRWIRPTGNWSPALLDLLLALAFTLPPLPRPDILFFLIWSEVIELEWDSTLIMLGDVQEFKYRTRVHIR